MIYVIVLISVDSLFTLMKISRHEFFFFLGGVAWGTLLCVIYQARSFNFCYLYLCSSVLSPLLSFNKKCLYWTGSAAKPSDCGFFESCQSEEAALPDQNNLLNVDQENPICSSVDTLVPYFM